MHGMLGNQSSHPLSLCILGITYGETSLFIQRNKIMSVCVCSPQYMSQVNKQFTHAQQCKPSARKNNPDNTKVKCDQY